MATSTTDVRAPAREPMVQMYARIPERLKRQLEDRAAAERRSVSAQLEVELEVVFANENAPAPLETAGGSTNTPQEGADAQER